MNTKCPLPKGFSGTRRVSGILFSILVSILALSLLAASAAVAAPFAYISNFSSGTVSVIDAGSTASCTGTGQTPPPPCVVATVPVGSFPGGVAVNPAGTLVYVANQDDGTVSVIRTSDNTVVGGPIPVGVQPWGVAVSADNSLVYVGLGSGGVAVIDANNSNNVSVIPGVGGLLNGILVVGSRVYVSDATAGQVVVIQGTSVIARIDIGSPPNSLPMGLVANLTGTRVYVVDLFLDPVSLNSVLEVSAIDTTSNPIAVAQTITIDPATIAAPGGIALSPDGSKLYVTSDAIDRLHVVTLSNGSVVTVPVGDSPVGVATDPDGRIYVGNAGAGTVTVFDPTFNPVTGLPAPKIVKVGSTPFVFGAFTTAGPPPPPPPAQFVLSLSTVGSGTISANPLPASGTYTAGTVVTLTAAPATNFQFAGWSGACTGSSACVVTMDAAKSVTATFTLKQFVLSLATVGSGTITANPLPVAGTYTAGTVVTLTAAPATNFQFAGWSGACTGSSCIVTMDAAKSVTATFTLKQFVLTLTTVGSGTITANPQPVGGTYGAGTVVALTAAPATNFQFAGWSGACTGSSCIVTMDAAKSVTATFTLKQFVLTLTTVGSGTISANPSPVGGTYGAGTVVALTATPAAGSQFSGWSGACSGTGACNVTMDAAKSVTATFAAAPPPPPVQFTLTMTAVGDGSIAPQPAPLTPAATAALSLAAPAAGSVAGKYDAGTNVTLTPLPAAGSRFSSWSGACSGSGACSVTMNAAKTVTATFTAVPPTTCDDKIADLQKKVAAFKHPWWHDHQLKVALKMYAESLAELNRAKAKVGNDRDKRIVHAQKEFNNGKGALCLGHYWRADHEFWETFVIAHEILKPNRR
jgi:YVTN family beta-propeller protein